MGSVCRYKLVQTMGYSSQFSSVQLCMTDIISPIAVKSLCIGNINAVKFHSSDSSYLLHPINQSFFSSQEMRFLDNMYNLLYDSSYIINNIPRLYEHSADASLNNSRFNSVKSLTNRSSYVYAYWVDSNGYYNTLPLLGKILKILKHQIEVMSAGNVMKHIYHLAYIQWLERLPDESTEIYSDQFDVWVKCSDYIPSNCCFIPINCILCKPAVSLETELNFATFSQVSIPVKMPIFHNVAD